MITPQLLLLLFLTYLRTGILHGRSATLCAARIHLGSNVGARLTRRKRFFREVRSNRIHKTAHKPTVPCSSIKPQSSRRNFMPESVIGALARRAAMRDIGSTLRVRHSLSIAASASFSPVDDFDYTALIPHAHISAFPVRRKLTDWRTDSTSASPHTNMCEQWSTNCGRCSSASARVFP